MQFSSSLQAPEFMALIAARANQLVVLASTMFRLISLAFAVLHSAHAQEQFEPKTWARIDMRALGKQLEVGDIVFIQIPAPPFKKIASATNSWTNHVGIVIDTSGPEPLIGESKIPLSSATPLSRFVGRSEDGRVRVRRLAKSLTHEEKLAVARSAKKRMGVLYDTGFNLNSRGQFCSRYVHEVLVEATGQTVGEIESFSNLLARNPATDLTFWRLWYFGKIPWQRLTVSPASVMESPLLVTVFDGAAARRQHFPDSHFEEHFTR